jgi:hypothetical protein
MTFSRKAPLIQAVSGLRSTSYVTKPMSGESTPQMGINTRPGMSQSPTSSTRHVSIQQGLDPKLTLHNIRFTTHVLLANL